MDHDTSQGAPRPIESTGIEATLIMSMATIKKFAPLYTRLSEEYGLGLEYPEVLLEHHKCRYRATPIDYTFVEGVCTSHEIRKFEADSKELLAFARDNIFPEKPVSPRSTVAS